jgi:hypothetical protein
MSIHQGTHGQNDASDPNRTPRCLGLGAKIKILHSHFLAENREVLRDRLYLLDRQASAEADEHQAHALVKPANDARIFS